MKLSIPTYAENVINVLLNNGYSAYFVGGAVRDCLLGNTPLDWDITTSATPEQVMSLFPRHFETGIKHGTVTVLWDADHCPVFLVRHGGDRAGIHDIGIAAFLKMADLMALFCQKPFHGL
ncbi:MAG: hypothetical protein IJA19_05280, partial [Clostridia bacterium]|nr:hypothetical protein [Clostridia bacterium]